jgi:hypothetical protein
VIAAGQWFSPVTPVSSTNKTDLHDIAEILLKVVLNTTTLTPVTYIVIFYLCTNQIFTGINFHEILVKIA